MGADLLSFCLWEKHMLKRNFLLMIPRFLGGGGGWRESTTIQIFTVEGILSWWRFARTNWTSTFWMVTNFIREFQFVVRHPKLEMSICSISIHWENNNHTVRESPFFTINYRVYKRFFSLWLDSQVIPTFSKKLPKLPRHGQMHSFDRFLHPQVT